MSYGYRTTPIIDYILDVLDDHVVAITEDGVQLFEAGWLVEMLLEVEDTYRAYGTI